MYIFELRPSNAALTRSVLTNFALSNASRHSQSSFSTTEAGDDGGAT
jgi:hypothetical protein